MASENEDSDMEPNCLRSKSQPSDDDCSGIVKPSSIGGMEDKSKSSWRIASGSVGHRDSDDQDEYPL